jgi:hypothetical protein
MSQNKFPFLVGSVSFQSSEGLINTAELLSENLFCKVKFGGLEKEICEEVPAVFISNLCGLQIILQGYEDCPVNDFVLTVKPQFKT